MRKKNLMAPEISRAATRRIHVLVTAGSALLAAGIYSLVTLFYSLLARYMYVERLELGLDENTMFAVTRMTPVDKGIVFISGILILLGIAAIVAAVVRARLRRASVRS